jgi:hypothetical protein
MDSKAEKDVLNRQKPHWEQTYAVNPGVFGDEPSEPAKKAAEVFHTEGVSTILELSAGQGRDTIIFAGNGFHVYALYYKLLLSRMIRSTHVIPKALGAL